jgi:hypothetical protein
MKLAAILLLLTLAAPLARSSEYRLHSHWIEFDPTQRACRCWFEPCPADDLIEVAERDR